MTCQRERTSDEYEIRHQLDSAESLTSDADIEGVTGGPLDSGTEIEVSELDDIVEMLRTRDQYKETLCRNLKELFFFYVGSPQDGSGYARICQTMERCIEEGVLMGDRRRTNRSAVLDMLEPLRTALTESKDFQMTPTDIRIIFHEKGSSHEIELGRALDAAQGSIECFLDAICRDAKDCFPIYVPVAVGDTSTVVMGGAFYFPFRDGKETRPLHGGFLDQAETQTRFFAVWQGRLLPSASETLMPKMLDHENIKQVPKRLLDRVCALVFLDDAFEPDFNKRNLTLNPALCAFQQRLDDPGNLKAFESWLQWCNKM